MMEYAHLYDQSTISRLWDGVDKSPRPSGCWLWIRPRWFRVKMADGTSRNSTPFRVMYNITNGEAPSSHHIVRTCDNDLCINPDHLTINKWRIGGDEGRERIIKRFWKYVDKTPGHGPTGDCWIWTGFKLGIRGYGGINIGEKTKSGFPKNEYAHRLSYLIHFGELPEGKTQVCHKCDNPPCVSPAHLFPGSAHDNYFDSLIKGRARRPGRRRKEKPVVVRAWWVRLTSEQGAMLRAKREEKGVSQPTAATSIGIDVTHLSRVEKGDRGLRLEHLKALLMMFGISEESLGEYETYQHGKPLCKPLEKRMGGDVKPYVKCKRGPTRRGFDVSSLPAPDNSFYRADLIRFRLKQKHFTLKQIVAGAEVSRWTLKKILLGENIRRDSLERVVRFAGLSMVHVLLDTLERAA